ncbi:MAG: hypothetical protein HOP28_16520 [Gemmatimonadales bacterium]|nr:hypothetical protein [Gemmatimonadales bacterium]
MIRFHTTLLAVLLTVGATLPSRVHAQEAPVKMDKYYLVLLRPGKRPANAAEQRQIFEGHMTSIRRLGAAGKMAVAGPIADSDSLEGVFVLTAATLEEAKALLAADTAVKGGYLIPQYYVWYAPAGLRTSASIAPPPESPPRPI